MASQNVTEVSQDTWDAEVLKSDQPVLIDFWATWCGPCVALAPVVEQVGAELAGKVKVVKVDVDANPELAVQHGIRGIPALLVYKAGEEVDRLSERSAGDLVTKLETYT